MPTDYTRLPCGAVVERYKIIGTETTVYRAMRPSSATGPHHSIEHIDGAASIPAGWYGVVSTERPPESIDRLPSRTTERYAAVQAWYAARQGEAYRLIFAAYPGLQPGRGGWWQCDGDIEVYG